MERVYAVLYEEGYNRNTISTRTIYEKLDYEVSGSKKFVYFTVFVALNIPLMDYDYIIFVQGWPELFIVLSSLSYHLLRGFHALYLIFIFQGKHYT